MKKFLVKLLRFTFLVISFLLTFISAMYFKSPKNISNWYYGVNSKQKPRIILVGSSNIYANYDYEKLNTYYSNYDVLGAHRPATVGFIPLITNLELLDLTPDDIVVFCLPYQLYDPGFFINFYDELPQQEMSRETILNAFKYNPVQAFKNLLAFEPKSYFNYLIKPNARTENFDGYVKVINKQVNLLKKQNYRSCQKSKDGNFRIESQNFDKTYIVNFMSGIIKNINTKVYFRFPAVHKGLNDINSEKIKFMSNNYNFINQFHTTEFDSVDWYDQRYHLNRCGAFKNTDLLIHELNVILNNH